LYLFSANAGNRTRPARFHPNLQLFQLIFLFLCCVTLGWLQTSEINIGLDPH